MIKEMDIKTAIETLDNYLFGPTSIPLERAAFVVLKEAALKSVEGNPETAEFPSQPGHLQQTNDSITLL
jgi:hypothetical protein